MGFYDEMADVAKEVMAEFKQVEAFLSRSPAPTPGVDVWDKPTQGTASLYALNVTVSDVQSDRATRAYADGETIMGTDRVLTCSAPETEPQLSDLVLLDGIPYPILKIIRIPSVGVAVAFKLVVSK